MNKQLRHRAIVLLHHADALELSLDGESLPVFQRLIARIQSATMKLIQFYDELATLTSHERSHHITHDILNLITPIVGYVELLEMRFEDTVVEPLTELQKQTMLLHADINHLINWATEQRQQTQAFV